MLCYSDWFLFYFGCGKPLRSRKHQVAITPFHKHAMAKLLFLGKSKKKKKKDKRYIGVTWSHKQDSQGPTHTCTSVPLKARQEENCSPRMMVTDCDTGTLGSPLSLRAWIILTWQLKQGGTSRCEIVSFLSFSANCRELCTLDRHSAVSSGNL